MKRLKERWNIKSNWQLFVILLVFAITGSTAAKFAGPIMNELGLSWDIGWYLYIPCYILILTPLYQVLLITFGWLFGELDFFWDFEKKMLRRMGFGFIIKK